MISCHMNSHKLGYSLHSNEISSLKCNQNFKKQPCLKPTKNTYSFPVSTTSSPSSIRKSNIKFKSNPLFQSYF